MDYVVTKLRNWPRNRGLIINRDMIFISPAKPPDFCLMDNEPIFCNGLSGRGVELTTLIHLMPRFKCLHGVHKDNFFFPVFKIKVREHFGIVYFLTFLGDDAECLCPKYSSVSKFCRNYVISLCLMSVLMSCILKSSTQNCIWLLHCVMWLG